ncbi:hypothetical protein GHT06_016551 [Daphnia sinensis]|uniref:UDENN domain-containing protein n=1 Tax=Daphnia sinensis TaxID=1820382 RepID=A0AAD5L7J4_9CRUS|nr:hypothetical protein GHT06_016551 [Daphnia sinensis]
MGSRLRNDVKHLIECFCEIVSPETSNKQPWVVQKFPESFKDDEMLKQVALFAFPCEVPCNTVQHFSFVLTSLDSKWTFGFCRQAPGAQTALVIISYLPWHEFFFKILNQIAELMQEQAVQDLNSFLEGLYQRDVPAPSTTLHIPFGRAHRVYTCKCPNTYTLPSIPENRNLTEYFNAVDAHNMMVIFASMLHERRIVMVSSRISRLSACIQAANAVIYPMIWQHIYIPVLPPHLMDYLLAPMPYLAGVPTSTWERVRKSELGELVVLDVDTNHIETPFDDLDRLPPDIVNGMRRRLKTPGNMMGDGVARVFLRALVQLIGGYRDALRFRQGEQITFCQDALVQSRPLALRPFLESMLQLQIFQQFIEERLEMLNSGQGFSDEFELEACLYSDKSSSRLKQQYKEWLTTMKKESGALFKKANPAMRNAVKTVGRLAKEKSRTAYREVRSKFKDMQIHRELEGASFSTGNTKLRDKPRSAPSSPKFGVSDVSTNQRRTAVSPATLSHQLNSNFLDRNHSLRRCETSVSQHYHVSGSSPGFPTGTNGASSSSSEESGTEDELQMTPLNLNLMDDMKDILARTASTESTPPAIDRSRKPSLSSPPISPNAIPVLRQHSAPILTTGPYSVQPIPLPPLRCRKRTEAQNSPLPGKGNAQIDLIRLDSATSLSPVDEFDPLGAPRKEPEPVRITQSNPVYSFHVPRQVAEPQVPSGASSGNGGAVNFKGYTSRFDTGSDPFSNLLAFTRTNLGPTVSVSEPVKANDSCVTDKAAWTTFD